MSDEKKPKRPRKDNRELKRPRPGSKLAMKGLKRSDKRCSFVNARNTECMAQVCHTDEDGRNYCLTHKTMFYKQGLSSDMENKLVVTKLDAIADSMGRSQTWNPVDSGQVMDIDELDTDDKPELPKSIPVTAPKPKRVGKAREMIQWKEKPIDMKPANVTNGNFKHGGYIKQFAGLDFDYYAANFDNNQFHLMDEAVKLSYAWLNVLMHQLQQLELTEDELKMTEIWGSKEFEGNSVPFEENIRKHAAPMELKIKLFDSFKKAMDSFRGCLKDRMELLPTALLVLRSFGIKFDKQAGMMVLAISEKLDQEELQRRGLVDNPGAPLPVDALVEEAHKELTDDDW